MSAEQPVAIIGIGCKLPGGSDTKDLYYEFLRNKGDGMTKPPSDRWDHDHWGGRPNEPGKYSSAMGGFINGIDQFDPLEFGISMKEAQNMDPSSRLILEVAHQALIDSGLDYKGSRTGVYVAQLLFSASEMGDTDRYENNSYSSLGKCISLRANRVSFIFDLRGPSLTLDTACSSSATAMHLALSAIKLGEMDQALIIGGSIMAHPMHNVMMSDLGVLSPTGSCKSFDAEADGYARAEGFAATVIKRLDKATADKDHIYSIVTGSSINANGRGIILTAPEADMQEEVIKQAYSLANRELSDAFFVELHVTGTPMGDPIEVNAVGKVFSVGRKRDNFLRVGSVKSNIGHTEGCSFLASLIKVSLMLNHKEIIPNIRFHKPNPKIDISNWKIMKVQTQLEPITSNLAAPDGRWVTSISSYGIGGANSHVVIESLESVPSSLVATEDITAYSASPPLRLFFIAAHTESAMLRWRASLATFYKDTTDNRILRSLSYDLARLSRSCAVRSFTVGPTISSDNSFSETVVINPKVNPKLCLVFSGQGPQHIAMGRELCASYPVFLATIKQSDEILVRNFGKESFLERTGLFVPNKEAKLSAYSSWPVEDVVYSIVFIQLALVDLIKSLGIEFSYVVGHSIGEIAMGYASGLYDKEAAIGITIARAAAMKKAEGNGRMVALGICFQRARYMIKQVLKSADCADGLWIAAINSPDAVTVAGREELVDILISFVKDRGFFAAKLNVTCAFHTPLMEPQEEEFKTNMKALLGTRSFQVGMNSPAVRIMSTVDGQWLERDMDVDYFWDNIRQPVLFGTAINKIIKENSSENILFLEIAPHPVLKAYILQCRGQSISLIRRPNSKVPAQNTGEHYQFLEGIGNLLTSGFKAVDLARLCSTPDAQQNFLRSHIPDYPYKKITCSSESASNLSIRIRPNPPPLSSPLFRMSLGTHPDLAGHLIFDVPVFPLSGYLDSVLEHGAIVIQDTVVLRPFVLNALGAIPAHVGCVINDNQWEFRSASTNTFENGTVQLDGVHARGSFLRHNPRLNHSAYPLLDLKAKLALSHIRISGEEFYRAIPSAYGYRDCFSTCIRQIHEVSDENSWGGFGYLIEQEIPTDTSDSRDKGYIIHPGILDSIMHSALAMFIDMRTKSFDFNGTFLPAKVSSLARWDKGNPSNLESQLHGTFWTYVTSRSWAPEGPFNCDYIVANSEGQVLLTIEGVEFSLAGVERAPITDKREECLTTVWQPKIFPLTDDHHPSPALSLDRPSYLCKVFEELITKAQTAGRYVIRTLDLDTSAALAKALDACLISSLRGGLVVEYFCAGSSAEDADVNARSMQHAHARPIVLDSLKGDHLGEFDHSFDIVLQTIDLSNLPLDVEIFFQYLVPNGVLLLIADGKLADTTEAESTQEQQNLAAFVEQLEAVSHFKISVTNLNAAEAIILVRSSPIHPETTEDPGNKLVVHHFTHGNEEQLVKIITGLSEDSEIWIVGDDDAIGIGALGIAACIIAESPDFVVRSLVFEDHRLNTKARNDIVRSLRRNSSLLEQHMKYTATGNVFVRRLVYGSGHIKASPALCDKTGSSVSTFVQPRILGPTEMQLSVDFLGMDNTPGEKSYVAFLGTIAGSSANITAKGFSTETRVLGIAKHPITDIVVIDQSSVVALPNNVANRDAVTLPIASLAPWLGLVDSSKISDSSSILLLGADSHYGFIAVQICQRFGAKFLCTVATPADAKHLSRELRVDELSVIISAPEDDISLAIQTWLTRNKRDGFDVAFNLQGIAIHGTEINFLTATGHYIHHQTSSSARATIPLGAPITQVINISTLVERYPTRVTATLADILAAHTVERFKLSSHSLSFSKLSNPANLSIPKADSLAIARNVPSSSIHVIEFGQLFDPGKSYLLVGGSSELGVRITVWMVSRGARKFVLTSRRGPKALTKVDSQYLYYLRSSGVSVDVLAADAGKEQDMTAVMIRANEMAPVGGIFLMTVVSRDGLFSSMDQRSFDDVYLSKVQTLNTILACIDPETLDFLLLFSTIGSVFGNAGQAAYCASQLYLDRMAQELPNTISISLPPITDSGMFKRLVLSSKGRSSTKVASKIGMTTAQVCSFIADSLVRRIEHYVPMIPIKVVPEVFSTCEPLLYSHLLPTYFLNVAASEQSGPVETPLTLLCELLGLSPEQIAKNIPLRDYGLDSLGAIRYSRELKGHLRIKISQIELLGSVTIADLESKLQDVTSAGDDSNPDDESSRDALGLLPLETERLAYGDTYTTDATPFQSRVGAQVSGTAHDLGGNDYSSGYLVSITSSALDIDRIRNAFNELVQRHGVLRTTFSWSPEGKLKQTVHSVMDFDITVIDFSHEADPTRKAHELALAASKEPNLKIDRLPLFTVTVINLGNNKWNLSLVFHDIIMDDASFGIVLNEFFELYHNGFDSLPPQVVQFSDFSDWFFHDRRIGSQEGQHKFWAENLKDIQPLNLGLPNACNTLLSDISQVEVKIDPTIISQYLAVMDQSGTTASVGFFAAFSILLYRLSLQTSFVMGTPVSQRRFSRLANVVGPITNILPITTTIHGDQSFHDYLSAFKTNLLASFANDDEGYYDGFHHDDPGSNPSLRGVHAAHFRNVFAHDCLNLDAITANTSNMPEKLLQLDDICSLVKIKKPYELLLDVYSKTGHVILHFDNHLFSAKTARKILDAYVVIVGRIALDSHVRISDIDVELPY